MTNVADRRSWRALLEDRAGAWFDSDSAVPLSLGLFVGLWTAFQIVSYASIGLHPDVVEVFAWSRHPAAGYYKHPPLGALMAAAWFAVFPVADASAHLLAMANSGLALYLVGLIARRYLSRDKRLFVLVLLLMTPFYQFHAVRFASNQTLLATWPLAVYCFIRAFETRGAAWSAAAGAAVALAMLGKYFSVYLIGGLAVAVLLHPARWTYLRSSSPWISMAVGLALLAPHIHWLATTGFQPVAYAMTTHGGATLWRALAKSCSYLLGSVGYVVLPVAAWWLATRPPKSAIVAALWPPDPERRLVVTLLWAPILLPAVTAPLIGAILTPIWTMPAWFLLPIVLLGPQEIALNRIDAARVALVVIAVTIAALATAPAIACLRQAHDREGRAHFRAVAEELTRAWRQRMQRRLTIVSFDPTLANAATFYSPDRPDSVPNHRLPLAPWVTSERLAREGFAMVCRADTRVCDGEALGVADPRAVWLTYDSRPSFLGRSATPARFVFVLVPPRR